MSEFMEIKNYPEYKISSDGVVISVFANSPHGKFVRKNQFALKHNISNTGYASVALYNNGFVKRLSIHRLVAEAFIPNPQNKPEVNHKDGNKINNKKQNLEWVTKSENAQHSVKVLGKKGPSSIPVKDLNSGIVFESMRSAAIFLKVKETTLRAQMRGQNRNKTNLVHV